MIWQPLLRTWLQHQIAQAALQAAVKHQEQGQPADAASQEQAHPIHRSQVGIVFALAEEMGGLEDLLAAKATIQGDGFRLCAGRIAERGVSLIQGGIGRTNSQKATRALLQVHRPVWVLTAGFSGGLVDNLKRGDLVLGTSIRTPTGEEIAVPWPANPRELSNHASLHIGGLVTVDSICKTPQDKRALHQSTGAIAVDMESSAVAAVCQQLDVPFLAVRIISDAVDDTLPADIDRVARQKSTAGRLGAAAGAIFRRPSSLKEMLKLKEIALVSSDRLAKFLALLIEQLVPLAAADES